MIRYALACDAGHRFDSWFADSDAYDALAGKGLVSCPSCGSSHVGKTIMAPAVARHVPAGSAAAARRAPDPSAETAPRSPGAPSGTPSGAPSGSPLGEAGRDLRALLRAMRAKVMSETQDVGSRFPEEARRMHDGDIPHRDIRGEATLDEARSLLDDGIMILPVPGEPGELN